VGRPPPGTISFSVRLGGRQWGWRERRAVPTASVLKALLLVAYLRRRDVARLPSLCVAGDLGLSRLDARDAARFFGELPGLVPRRHRAYATWLLAHVVAAQRWGIGQTRLPAGWRLLFKGGWGSGSGAVDHRPRCCSAAAVRAWRSR